MSLEVEPEDPETEVLGKEVADLQTGITMNDSSIFGTLNYVTGYTGYSGDPTLQEGHFFAGKVTATAGATTTVELLGGYSGPVTLDSDMNFVVRIANKNTQKLKVTTTKSGESVSKIYDLRSLMILPKEE